MKFLHTLTKCGLLMAGLLLLSSSLLAQRTVKGKVTDAESSEGLIGATVTVVGTTRGAVTDIDGNYSVEVPAGATQLRFAYTGYAEEVIALTASNVVEVALKAGTVLDEVVVVGYGTVKSKEVTSAVASLKSGDFNRGNVTSAAQLIQGKVAGVTISRPGSNPNGEFTIRLRGLSSLSSGSSPLIVVDGVPGVSLNLVDPNDIESIDILKDGSAAAIYGTRGSAGVVLITTKKGASGRTMASYNGFVAFDQVAKRYDVLNAEEFVQYGGVDLSPQDPAGGTDTDWFGAITQTGKSQAHNLSLSGGTANGSYRASFNYRSAEGILRESGFNRYNGGLSFTQKALNNKLTFNGNFYLTTGDRKFSFNDAFRFAIVQNPTSAITSTDPLFKRYGGYVEQDLFDYINPVAIIDQNTNGGRGNQLLGNVKADFEVVKDLILSASVAQERSSFTQSQYFSKQSKFGTGVDRNGVGTQNVNNFVSNLLELTANYKINFAKDRNLSLLGGYSYQQFDYNGLGITAANIVSNEFGSSNLGNFISTPRGQSNINSFQGRNKLIAFFGRATVNIDDTYFGSVGLRREGSTRFGPDNKWGVFPFVSAGVNIEKLVDLADVNQLKLRVGYGVTGNQPNQNSLYRRTFVQGAQFFYNGSYVPSYGPNQNPNPNLKWEEKGEINVGLDFAFADYKITGAFDYYNRLTKDLIIALSVPVPPNLTPTTFDNIASIRNTGFEATLNFNNVINKENFTYTPGIVFSTYKVKLEDFGRPDTLPIANAGSPGQNGVNYTIVYSGAQLGQFWGPIRESVNGDGSVTYKDINGDGQIEKDLFNKDQTKIGNGVPRFELGINNTFTLGKFDLNFFLRGVFGHDLVNEYRNFYENLDPTAKTWNKIKTEYFNPNLTAQSRFDNTHVEKATFLRLDNATLGYNFRLASSSWFTQARVYVSGQNLFTLTNYTGVDPEPRLGDSNEGDNPLAPGIDRRSTYFLARTVSFGVTFGF